MRKITLFALCAFAFLVFASTFAFADGAAAAPKTSGLVDDLTSKLSLKPEQATGAAGAVLALAKTKLTPENFAKLAAGFPEIESLLKAAPATSSSSSNPLAALAASQGGAAGLLGQFSNLGIPVDTAAKIVPEVLAFVKGKQGDDIMNMLAGAVK